MRHRSQPNPECGCHTFNRNASCRTQLQDDHPVSEVLIKRFISNVYIKVHWHGTTEKPKVRNGAGLFNIRVRTVSTSSHDWYEVYPALLYITAIQDGPSRVLRTLPINLMMARLFSGEDSTFSSLLAYSRKLENDNLLHITNVQRGHPCVRGSRKARMKDYGHIVCIIV